MTTMMVFKSTREWSPSDSRKEKDSTVAKRLNTFMPFLPLLEAKI